MTLDVIQTLDTEQARITPVHGHGKLTPYNSERAILANQKRWADYRIGAERAMVSAALGENVPLERATRIAAYVKMIQNAADVALSDDPRSITAARFVREAIGADIGAPSSKDSDTPAGGATITLSEGALQNLAKMLLESQAKK